jgi:hypothetical protein
MDKSKNQLQGRNSKSFHEMENSFHTSQIDNVSVYEYHY